MDYGGGYSTTSYGAQGGGYSSTSYGAQGGGYSTTSYGAQGGAGGGGFIGGSQGGSQSNTAGKGTYGKDSVRPVTILQVLDAQQPHPDADFSIDDVEISQVTFVGQIRNVSTQATNITYKLDDGTGSVEVKQWIETDGSNPSPSTPTLVENQWVRVWGRLKAFNNRRHVGAHVIRPIADKMEITYHLLETTYVHLYFTRGLPEQVGKGEGNDGESYKADGGGLAAEGAPQLGNLSMGAKRVYQFLKSAPQNNEGLHIQTIAAGVRITVAEVLKGGDELLAESLIYTTVDDHTWAILEF